MQRLYFSMKELEALIGCKRQTVIRWRKTRAFPAPVRLNGNPMGKGYYPRQAVLEWLASNHSSAGELPQTPPGNEEKVA